jgi:LPS sulfotransferase NodH
LLGPRSKAVRALIFAQGRSGTTLLENLLCSSGHFTRNGEVLKPSQHKVYFPRAYVEGLARKNPQANYVCHVKPYHLDKDRQEYGLRPVAMEPFVNALSRSGWQIIHLTRENKLRQYLSIAVARARGAYEKFDDSPENQRITADREEFTREVTFRIESDRRERAALAHLPHIELEYGRDLEQAETHQATVDRVLDYLGLERRPIATTLRKINTRSIASIVENVDELANWARELGVERWLDDE